MRLPSVPTLPMVEHLNQMYFDSTWNAPDDHARANFELYKAAPRLQIGAVPVNQSVVGLPTTDKVYAVYRVADHVFGRFVKFPENIWIKDSDILTSNGVSMVAYATSGRMIPSGHIHLRYDPVRSIVLIAIAQVFTSKCIGQSQPDLYMSVYHDTSRNTPIVTNTYVVSTTLTSTMILASLTAAVAQYSVGTMVYVNGWLYDPTNVPALVVGDVVEIVSDPDIVGYCDLTVDDNQTGYYSNLFGEYREVLHIPKILNPNNYIITHDTLTIGIFDTISKRGVYGHQIDNHAIESVTHNDFSMSRSILQAFQNSLSAQGITVRLYVRFATNLQPLMSDANRIEDLYTLPDAEIKKQLAGLSLHQILEWKASNLEQSSFLNLFYKFPGFDSTDALTQYTEAVGYYDVASTLSQAMHYYTYKGSEVEILKPVRLIGYPCQVIVYANGRKVPDYAIGLSNSSSRSIHLGFTSNSYVSLNTRIGVYIAEGGSRVPTSYFPTADQPIIVMDSDDYTLVKIYNYDTPQAVWNGSTTKGYHIYPVSPGDYRTVTNVDGSVTFKVSANHYGESFYLVPNCGLTTSVYSLDEMIADKKPILIPLTVTDADGTIIPLIAQRTVEVYVNGYRLIEGIDYSCDPLIGPNDDVLQTLLEVSNMDYLNLSTTGNILEVLVHGDSPVSSDKGYVISNMMHRTLPPMIWSKSCGRAFAHGILQENVTETGNVLISSTAIPEGSPYLAEWSLPYSVAKLMFNQSINTDNNLRTRVDQVLEYTPITYPDTVLVYHLYALYSPYLAQIVSDVASGALIIVNELKDDAFLNQFSNYQILFDRDPLISAANSSLDRRFVTLAAHYANLSVQDPQQMILVQRLISLLLTPAQLSINEVLV